MRASVLRCLLAFTLLGLIAAPGAAADLAFSSNWAGYAVHRDGLRFQRIVGEWRQPSGHCRPHHAGFSAVWVGLGGFASGSPALEQVGSELDCTASGTPVSSAWYELVPGASRPMPMAVHPGDELQASVAVNGRRALLALTDRTTGSSFSRVLHGRVDVSSAEWIVEAPSQCFGGGGGCEILPLADFGTTTISQARVVPQRGPAGAIADRRWKATSIRLIPGFGGRSRLSTVGAGSATATPSPLTGGGAFSVRYGRTVIPMKRGLVPVAAAQAELVHPARG